MGRVIGYGLAIVIAVAIVGYKFSRKGDQSVEVRAQMVTHLEQLEDFDTHGGLYVQWLDAHHEVLFEKHHMMGGRYSTGSFDGNAYMDELFAAMAADAQAAGYEAQAVDLKLLSRLLYWDTDGG